MTPNNSAKFHTLYRHSPCKNCPFRKNTSIETNNIIEYLNANSFICHESLNKNIKKQCAGHMLINKEENTFYKLAKLLIDGFTLKGEQYVFQSKSSCIKYHQNKGKNRNS